MKKLMLAVAASVALAGAQAQKREYILTTATTGGTYYPVGVAISTLTKVKVQPEHGFGLSAISSSGSDENISMLAKNEAQFALLQGLYGPFADRDRNHGR